MSEWLFLEPVDVLNLRGNQLFGEAGSYAAPLMPPWPSLLSGAVRSRMLASEPKALEQFLSGDLGGALGAALGTPEQPGTLRITALLGGRRGDGDVEALLPVPADVVVRADGVSTLRPVTLPARTSAPAGLQLPVLCAPPAKPEAGYWLNAGGIAAWLADRTPKANDIVRSGKLWESDTRVGVAIGRESGTVEEGALFSTDAVAPRDGFGFLVGLAGCEKASLPCSGLVRLGGDGRAAVVHTAAAPPLPDFEAVARTGQFKLLLVTSGLFEEGWAPPGLDGDRWTIPSGGSARLRSAAVPRHGVVSGWDLAQWRPKPAKRVAPAGSVYWFDQLEGGAEALRRLHESCLEPGTARAAEGFNHVWIGAWSDGAGR